jgi:tetratricopeptide (TPR) repeat protein
VVLDAEDFRTNERRCAGRFDKAVFWFGLASRVDPTFDKPEVELGAVHYYAGRCAEMGGRPAEAGALFDASAQHFRAATARDPDNSSSWHQLGEAEAAAGRLSAAVAAFEQAVRLAPQRSSLRASLGRAYGQSDQCAAARRELSEALRLDATNQLARAELERLGSCQ